MKMQPAGDKVLVEIEPDDLPEYDDDDGPHEAVMLMAKVAGVGPEYGKESKDKGVLRPGMGKPVRLSVGDTIHVRCHSTKEVFEQDGKKYKYVEPYDIMGVMAGGPARRMADGMMDRDSERDEKKPEKKRDYEDEEEEDGEERDMMD